MQVPNLGRCSYGSAIVQLHGRVSIRSRHPKHATLSRLGQPFQQLQARFVGPHMLWGRLVRYNSWSACSRVVWTRCCSSPHASNRE